MTKYTRLVDDGMTEKYADKYISRIQTDDGIREYNNDYIRWAHSKVFSGFFAYTWRISEENYVNYISDYMCYKLYPFNGWQSIWIDDKMTIRYILNSNSLKKYMPEYYYYLDRDRGLIRLVDHPCLYERGGSDEINMLLSLLKDKKELACKPNNGAQSKGFLKLTFDDERFFINGKEIPEKEFVIRVGQMHNCIITEYLHPIEFLAPLSGGVPIIKIWTLKRGMNTPIIAGSVIRLNDEVVDYGLPFDLNKSMLYANLDLGTGVLHDFRQIYYTGYKTVDTYNGTELADIAYLPDIQALHGAIMEIADYLGLIECMELDVVPSDKGYKLIEINSFLCEVGMQLYQPFSSETDMGNYLRQKLSKRNKRLHG